MHIVAGANDVVWAYKARAALGQIGKHIQKMVTSRDRRCLFGAHVPVVRLSSTAQRGEEILQRRFVQQAFRGSAAVIEERIGQSLFARLHVEDLFLDRAGGHEPVNEDRLRLADPVGAVHCLTLDRRVPPRIIEDHRVGLGQGQADTARLEAEQEHRRIALREAVEDLSAVLCLPREGQVGNASLGQIGLDQAQHLDELRKTPARAALPRRARPEGRAAACAWRCR